MEKINIIDSSDFFMERQNFSKVSFEKQDYLDRIQVLLGKMKQDNISHVIIYGDREHFSNIEYFSGYDCRFEEALLIIDSGGRKTIVIGNEGVSYSALIPYEIERVLYHHFSLQGQPRDNCPSLSEVLKKTGIPGSGKTGIVGYKYFEDRYAENAQNIFDIPAYILDEIKKAAGNGTVINYTSALTGLPNGVRVKIRSPKEIAWVEYAAGKCTNNVLNMLEALDINETELSLTSKVCAELHPQSVHPMINFGKNIKAGLRSPDETKLKLGEPCGICYGIRGSLVSRVGIAAYNFETYDDVYKPLLESFYKPYWSAVAAWYECAKVGVTGGELYDSVMSRIGSDHFNVFLNPGHNTGCDEWVNSPSYKGSKIVIESGTHMQCDIIASGENPVRTGICEDTVVFADSELREKLKAEYPDTYRRITMRQKMMRKMLGININDSLLPMSNFNGVYFPFMLNTGKIFSKAE